MLNPNYILLYVNNPQTSGQFYANLLGREPVDSSPTFVMFALDSGVMLGLWSRDQVQPAVTAPAGSGELCFSVDGNPKVDAAYTAWKKAGLPILQERTAMDFGYTFVALDPDGHRLRVFAPTPR